MGIKFEVKLLTFKYFLQKNWGLFFGKRYKIKIYSLAKFYLPLGLYFSNCAGYKAKMAFTTL